MAVNNSRLVMVAKLVESADTVADIGTDHALLPIYMIANKIAKRVIACDIAEGPLSVAESNVTKKGMNNVITLRLADGLDGVMPEECDTVTISGMGGDTIADIISRAPWLKIKKQTLVLQPMSSDDRLRIYLTQNGFSVLKEKAVYSKGRVYTVIKAVYTGEPPEVAPEFPYIGKLFSHKGEVGRAETDFVYRRLKSMKKCLMEIEGVERRKSLYEQLRVAIAAVENICKNFI